MNNEVTTVLHGLWRTVKFFAIRKVLSKDLELLVSAGLLSKKFKVPEKTIKNGISLNSKGNSRHWRFLKSNDGIYVDYESLPLKTINRYKLPPDPIKAFELLQDELHSHEEIHADLETQHMKSTLEDAYQNRWPPYSKFYKKVKDASKRILYAKSHAMIEQILLYQKSGFSSSLIFDGYTAVLKKRLDEEEEPKLYTISAKYFWRLMREARLKGPDKILIHDSLGVERPDLVKMTGVIRAYSRELMRHPKRLLLREIQRRIEKKFNVSISKSTLKTLKANSFDRNILEYDSNGKVWSKQNGLPKLIRFLAEGPGEQFQGDYYKHQFYCRSNAGKVIRLWLYIVIDVFSMKIVGWAASQEHTEYLAIEAFKMAFIDHSILPEEVVVDHDPLYKRQAFKRMFKRLNSMGVITTKGAPHTPTWRAEVESTFAVFQKLHSAKKWYIGEGVKSKNKSGNPASEFVKSLYPKAKQMLSEEEMVIAVGKMVKEYNDASYDDKKKLTPNLYFNMYSSKRVIKLQEWMVSLMFWKTITSKRIKDDGRIDLQVDTVPYIYQVSEKEVFWKYKNTDVRMCYQPNDLSVVHIFKKYSLEFIGAITPRLMLTRDNKEAVLKQHRKNRRDILSIVHELKQADRNTIIGITDRPPLNDSLDAKLLNRKNRREKFNEIVAKVKIEP